MKRFIFKDNSALSDFSYQLENYHGDTVTIDYTLSEDYLYVGAELPFNSLFFDLSTANTASADINIEYWTGTEWVSMVNIIDETKTGGASFGKSGHVTWTTDKQEVWHREDTVRSNGTEQITGLGNITIYDLYWMRISFKASLDVGTALNFVGYAFCSSEDVEAEYRLLSKSSFKTSYEAGKTDWEKEIIIASRLLVEDLIDKNSIILGEQLLDRRKFKDACVSKVAEIVFTNLGDDYTDDAEKAKREYKNRLDKKNYRADLNGNARIDKREMGVTTGGLYR